MFEMITRFAGYLEHATFITYPITIFLGFLSGVTALTCLFPLVPAIAGFIGAQNLDRKRVFTVPLFIMLGSIVTLVALGIMVSTMGLTLQKSLGKYWSYFIGTLCLVMGLFIFGIIKVPTNINIPKIKQKGYVGPFFFGICAGGVMGIGSSCCMPVLPLVLTYAAIQGKPVHGALIMASFAIGQSIPLFAIGLFSNLLGSASERWSVHVRRIAGIALIGSGLYFLLKG